MEDNQVHLHVRDALVEVEDPIQVVVVPSSHAVVHHEEVHRVEALHDVLEDLHEVHHVEVHHIDDVAVLLRDGLEEVASSQEGAQAYAFQVVHLVLQNLVEVALEAAFQVALPQALQVEVAEEGWGGDELQEDPEAEVVVDHQGVELVVEACQVDQNLVAQVDPQLIQ